MFNTLLRRFTGFLMSATGLSASAGCFVAFSHDKKEVIRLEAHAADKDDDGNPDVTLLVKANRKIVFKLEQEIEVADMAAGLLGSMTGVLGMLAQQNEGLRDQIVENLRDPSLKLPGVAVDGVSAMLDKVGL